MAKNPVVEKPPLDPWRIVVQHNDFLLPSLLHMLRTGGKVNVSPLYQRRLRWNQVKKSRLIESFLLNIPVPPVFLDETQYATYEVMDGQQRISTIREFFNNQLALKGLHLRPDLNSKRFSDLSKETLARIERRSLSAIVLLTESSQSEAESFLLRQAVFERLNTGGLQLNAQEIRNCLHASPFNDLLHELAGNQLFTQVWEIPPHEVGPEVPITGPLAKNNRFLEMQDNELVLRFFAYRDSVHIKSSPKSTLDECMSRYRNASSKEIAELKCLFLDALQLSYDVYGKHTFRLPPKKGRAVGTLSSPLYDAVMVAMSRFRSNADEVRQRAATVAEETASALSDRESEFYALVVGRPNTKQATKDRANAMTFVIQGAISTST
ncbi:MAG: DUF262 domain-containing protein [Dehalococcoidia bacterium]|nr:DUF262 domain-containing protein [Dehalococcoidia bacterium]